MSTWGRRGEGEVHGPFFFLEYDSLHLLELLDSALNLRGFCVLGAEAVDPAFGLVDLALLRPVLFFENFAAQGGFFYEEGIISRIFSGLSALKCYGSGCQFIKKRAIM